MERPAVALEHLPLGDKARARPLPGKSPAKPGKSMVKFSVGRRARRSTIKLLARCNHFIVDKEPQHEELPPRCCADRSCCYRLWQEGRSQAGCRSGCRSCRRCTCCRSGRCSSRCCCSGQRSCRRWSSRFRRCQGCCQAGRRRSRREDQGSGRCRRTWRCRRCQGCNEEVILFTHTKKPASAGFFVCAQRRSLRSVASSRSRPPDRRRQSSRHCNPKPTRAP